MKKYKNYGSRFIAMLLLMAMCMSSISLEVFASTTEPDPAEPPKDYFYLDGKRVDTDDEMVLNTVSVRKSNPLKRSASQPPVTEIVAISNDFTPDATLSLQGTTVAANRYAAHTSDGITYEVFCGDPLRKGPETSGDGDDDYRVLGESAIWLNALKYGSPTNPYLSDFTLPENERLSNTYLTRVAVAMGRNPVSNFSGDNALIEKANQLAMQGGPEEYKNYDTDKPPIIINGKRDEVKTVTATGETAESGAFEIAYNRRTNNEDNPFRFEWDSKTPNGAELWVDGSLVATAPDNVDTIFTTNNISSFELKMPNITANHDKEAKVNLVGIHNEWSDKVWLLRHSSHTSSIITDAPGPGIRQDLLFYIPPVNASAAFTFTAEEEPEPEPTPTPTPTPEPEPTTTSVKIQKIDAITRENIPGALIRLRGISSAQVITEDGQIKEIDNTGINLSQVLTAGAATGGGDVKSTVTDGVWTLEGLPYGAYVAEEERAPENYSLLPQHTSYSFWLLPGNVTIKLNQDESTVYVDDVGVSVHEALNAAIAGIQNYDDAEGLAKELQEILDTLLSQLQVDAVFTVEVDKSDNSQLITFENFPFGKIEVTKYDEVTGETLAGTHFRIQGYFPEGNPNGMPIDRIQVTGSNGKTVFEDLPAGQYTITEAEAPPGYQFDGTEYRSISLTWGQTASTTFYNKPKTFVEVIKVDGNDTTKLLDGARFRLSEPTSGEIWEGTTSGGKVRLGEGDGSFGNQLHEGKLYILTEIQAPNGYVLDPSPIEVIVAADNQLNTITVRNYRNPSLTIVKRDKNNGQPRLEGAVFEVEYENGTTVSGSPFTTNKNGEIVIDEILFEGNNERTLIVTETIPPDGYNLSEPTWKKVTLRKGEDNVVVFENTRKPTLEIVKVDSITGKNLEGAEFTIEKLEEPGKGMLTGNPFTTDTNGKITLPFQYSGKYRIVEVSTPNNYWLNPQQQNREWIIEVKDNEDYTLRIENTLLPTLIITKWNAVTYKPVPLTHFRIEYEVPNSGQVQLVGEFVTNSNGQIVIPYTRVGWYRVTETKAAPGMSLNTNNSYRVYLNPGDNSYMPIPDVTENNPNLNTKMPVFKEIQVFGGNDFFVGGTEKYSFPENAIVAFGNPNEIFTVANENNSKAVRTKAQIDVNAYTVGEFSADSSGILVLGGLQSASYTITNSEGKTETTALRNDGGVAMFNFTATSETPTPTPEPPTENNIETGDTFDGEIEYIDDPALISQISQSITVSNGEQYWNSGTGVWNWPLNSIVIKKQDATNGNLLAGATFDLIYTTSGESGTKGTVIGTYTTDHSGVIVITGLEPGNYVVEEIQAPQKYTLSLNNRQNVNLKADGTSIVETTFSNYPYGSLLISKIDSITRAPLAGAQFLVTDSTGTVVGSSNGLFTTDSAGNILIEKLPPDTYVVTEQRSPNGYIIGQNATQTIMVQPDGRVYRLEFTNDPLSSLIIRKIDSYDGSPLAGAKFEVRRTNGEFIGEYTTDQQGLIEVPNILGWFTVTEMEAPSGYAVDTNAVRTVEVRSQAPTYVTFYNPREGSLTIEKVDGSGNPLSGAQFRITRQNGEFVANHTTGASGMVNLPNLSAGWYHVEEIYAPNGYVISQTGKSAEVKANSAAHLTFVNLPQPTLTIQKLDETGNPLSGAKFMVSEIGGSFSKEVTIGAGGTASLVLPLTKPQANFQIVETHAPQGYVITEPSRVITANAGENYFESFVNYKTPSLIINKHDVDGNPLNGATFEVRSLDGALVATATSNNGGVAAIGSIAPGSYEIKETRAPAGYVVTEQSQIIQIKAGDTATATFVNEVMPGLTIEKVDEKGKPLSGAEFEVRTLAGTLVQRVTTNNGGVANIPQIAVGSYTITEVKAPTGYSITEQSRNIEIAAGQSLTERFVNYKQPSIIIEKIDDKGQPLANAVFEVRTLDGTRIAEVKTNSGGMAIVEGLTPNSYEVVETQAPSGYVITEQSRIVTVAAGDIATVRFVNYKQPSLVIEKVDEDGNPLSGAEFEVRKLNGELIQRVTTNNAGVASIAVIAPGAYVIAETRAPQGYVITEVARNIEIIAGESITERFVNYRQPSLIIEKVDENGNPLSGAVFEVRTITGTRIAEITTNNGGMATVSSLDPGAYEVVETRAPQGYVITETSRAIQIVAGETKTERFVNYRQPSLIIEKVDENGQPLAGAEFEIRKLNGELVHRVITNNGGTATIEHLDPNSYEIIETRAPEGYTIVEVSRAIQIVAGQTITERFVNPRLATFVIQKIDGDTSQPLTGVIFEITTLEGEKIRNSENGSFEFITDNAGMIRLPKLEAGSYVAVETKALPGYVLAQPETFVVGHDRDYIITIRNYKLPDYNILKIDGSTDEPLKGVTFEIAHYYANGNIGEKIRNPKDGSYTWITDSAGLIRIPNLEHGTYIATELKPLAGYKKADPSIFVVGDNQPTTITVRNYRYSEWNILKVNGDTNKPLQGVIFEVAHYFGDGSTGDKLRNSITGSFEFTTNADGLIRLGVLEPGTYIATETKPLDGYIKSEPTVFVVTENDTNTTVTIRNYKLPTYNIRKVDGDTDKPLSGVVFEIQKYFANGSSGERIHNPIDGSFEFVTDEAGLITLPTLPHATYVAIETRPLDGYAAAEPHVFVVGDNEDTTITIRNYKNPDFVIRKLDGDTQQPLEGVQFKIYHSLGNGDSGEMLRNPVDNGYIWTTDKSGRIHLNNIEPGVYIATESRPLPGYAVAEPKTFTVGDGGDTTITIYNHRMADYAIKKIDGDTNKGLSGVEFEIAYYLGEGRNGERLVNPANGTTTFVTDNAGMINLPSIEKGSYVAIETKALNGYTAAEPTIFIVGDNNQDRTIVIKNYRQAELTIQKINAVNRQPLQGVIFQISRPNGEQLVNPKTGNHDFTTDRNGLIYLPVIVDGDYYLTETKAISGYLPLNEPVRFSINSETRQRQHLLVVENTPASGLLIIKRDAASKEPLAGVTFEIRHTDGRIVQGNLQDENQRDTANNSPQLNASNGFTTDNRGRINLNHLAAGVYHVTETKALDGYILDSTVHTVTVEPGKQTVLEVENKSLAGLRIKKIDAVTKQGIFNVEFMLFDSSGKVVGNFYSDNNGIVDFPANIVSGRYTIRETRPAPGYSPDDMPRTIDFVAGKVTEIVWENVPKGGQLQISKVSGDYNEMNALAPGTPLKGAIFEIYDARTGNVVDRIASNERGMAVSKPLPLGRYYAQEVQAPAFYKINPQPIHFDIEFDTQIVKTVFPNFSANVGVSIDKTGPKEVMQGHNITYDIKNVRNESSIPLSDFFWRDILPTNAVRADKLVTGTYNAQLRYKIMGKTNKGNEIVIADNLTTTRNNVVELKPVHLGLASDEYLVEFSLHFGQVPAGFAMVETAKLMADVLPGSMANLPNGMMFANKVDVGGKIPGTNEWAISNSTAGSTVYNPNTPKKIPQSGY